MSTQDLVQQAIDIADKSSKNYIKFKSTYTIDPQITKVFDCMANSLREFIDKRIVHELVYKEYFDSIKRIFETIVKAAENKDIELKHSSSFKEFEHCARIIYNNCPDKCPVNNIEIKCDGQEITLHTPNTTMVRVQLEDPLMIDKAVKYIKMFINVMNSDEHTSRHPYIYES